MSWTSSSLATFTLQECPGSAACSRCGSLDFSPSLWVHFLNSEAGVCSCSSQTRQCHWVNSVLRIGPVRLWSHPPKHATSSKDQAPMEQSCRDEHTDSVRVKSVPVWDPSTALCCRLWKHAHLFIGGNHWELYITLGELSFLVLSWELSTSHPQAWGVQHTEQALTLPGFQPAPQTTKQQKDLAELNSLRMVFLSNAMSSLNETCEGFFFYFCFFFPIKRIFFRKHMSTHFRQCLSPMETVSVNPHSASSQLALCSHHFMMCHHDGSVISSTLFS